MLVKPRLSKAEWLAVGEKGAMENAFFLCAHLWPPTQVFACVLEHPMGRMDTDTVRTPYRRIDGLPMESFTHLVCVCVWLMYSQKRKMITSKWYLTFAFFCVWGKQTASTVNDLSIIG